MAETTVHTRTVSVVRVRVIKTERFSRVRAYCGRILIITMRSAFQVVRAGDETSELSRVFLCVRYPALQSSRDKRSWARSAYTAALEVNPTPARYPRYQCTKYNYRTVRVLRMEC